MVYNLTEKSWTHTKITPPSDLSVYSSIFKIFEPEDEGIFYSP